MPLALWGDALLLSRAQSLQALLNAGHTLRLFVNNFPPDPTTPKSSFVEATFTGYAPISLASQVGAPTLVQAGQYQIATPVFTFTCTGGTGQTVYGWFVDDGTNMVACQLLDSPVPLAAGGAYALQLRPQEISQSILP